MFEPTAPMDRITGDLAEVTRRQSRVVEELIASREAIRMASGVSVEVWLTASTRLPRADRLALQVAADVLPSLPGLRSRFSDGAVSWPVVRRITRAAVRLSDELRSVLDVRMSAAIDRLAEADAERVLDVLDLVMAELRPEADRARERRLERGEFVALQPFLDGTGGSLYAEYGAINFAAVSDAIIDAAPQVELDKNPHGDPRVSAENGRTLGQARAKGLLELCTRAADGKPARPKILATVSLETLLGMQKASGHLLTQLLGGKLRITATAARRLADLEGCDLRLIVHDEHGATVGVGRTRRLAPGWAKEAAIAFNATCTFPGCNRPARLCDIDHSQGWDDGGPTDTGNLGPIDDGHHTLKTRKQWDVTRTPDQSTTWTHRLTGVSLTQPSLWTLQQLAAGTHPAADERPDTAAETRGTYLAGPGRRRAA